MNEQQRARFATLIGRTTARRLSFANSAGIGLGEGYHFDLTRPGLALYGGTPSDRFTGMIAQVAHPQAEILQRRLVRAGETVGYNATWTAVAETEVAIINLGYADGYARAFSNVGQGVADGVILPVIGRVSMDLIALDVTAAPALAEADWIDLAYDLASAAAASGVSPYELLTRLAHRYERHWA